MTTDSGERQVAHMTRKAIVAIVGRPNVGKSTLFNDIAQRRLSIVEDTPGVTRDRLYASAEWREVPFTLVDTGGIETDGASDMLRFIREQAEEAIQEADVILFIVDARVGMTHEDQEIAKKLRQSNKPILLVANKADSPNQQAAVFEFYSLGLGDPIAVSATNKLNLGDLLDDILALFPEDALGNFEEDSEEIHVAIIGRPNVGKSSLFNSLIGKERSIVSDEAGTTRDAVDTTIVRDGQTFVFVDTAGMRKRARVEENVERYSVMRALRAVDRADIVLMVIDAVDGVTEQDKKIAGYAHEAGKGIILVVNKWDLVEKETSTSLRYTEVIRQELAFMQYAPVIFVSALTKQRLHRLPELIKYVAEQHAMRISTSVLNQLVEDALNINPPPNDKGRRLKLLYSTQVKTKPPTFVFFVNDPKLMHFSYQRYLENKLRESMGFEGTPIHFIVRSRSEKN